MTDFCVDILVMMTFNLHLSVYLGCLLTHFVPSALLQIHAHYELKKTSRHRRNLAITGGVALSIITAPVIAAVSVGKRLDRHPLCNVNF